jgi:hypothetical protein
MPRCTLATGGPQQPGVGDGRRACISGGGAGVGGGISNHRGVTRYHPQAVGLGEIHHRRIVVRVVAPTPRVRAEFLLAEQPSQEFVEHRLHVRLEHFHAQRERPALRHLGQAGVKVADNLVPAMMAHGGHT